MVAVGDREVVEARHGHLGSSVLRRSPVRRWAYPVGAGFTRTPPTHR
jgi:hypothetical protein